MTSQQIELVQQSWEKVKPVAHQAGLMFYNHLFSAAPQIRHLFKGDLSEQSAKLVRMLTYIVSMLKRAGDMGPDIDRLASAHNGYGARPEHYDVVGASLIQTLKDGLGTAWNAELEEAWIAVFSFLKNEMITAQSRHMAAAPGISTTLGETASLS